MWDKRRGKLVQPIGRSLVGSSGGLHLAALLFFIRVLQTNRKAQIKDCAPQRRESLEMLSGIKYSEGRTQTIFWTAEATW